MPSYQALPMFRPNGQDRVIVGSGFLGRIDSGVFLISVAHNAFPSPAVRADWRSWANEINIHRHHRLDSPGYAIPLFRQSGFGKTPRFGFNYVMPDGDAMHDVIWFDLGDFPADARGVLLDTYRTHDLNDLAKPTLGSAVTCHGFPVDAADPAAQWPTDSTFTSELIETSLASHTLSGAAARGFSGGPALVDGRLIGMALGHPRGYEGSRTGILPAVSIRHMITTHKRFGPRPVPVQALRRG